MSDSDGGANLGPAEIERIFREGSGRAVASLIRMFGDIDVAEDAVQDAFAVALKTWRSEGVPQSPIGWIVATGRNRAIDRLRRESLGRSLLGDLAREESVDALDSGVDPMDDDALRLIFTCCHPALSQDAQVALTLRLLCGLDTRDVARSFLVEESTMAQRLVRAKRKIKTAPIPYRVPASEEWPQRLPPVLAVVYLVYNAGSSRPVGERQVAGDLCTEGLRLARLLHALMPNEPEVAGLLALLLLSESRRATRFDESGALVLLRDQERASWDRNAIDEGQGLLRTCIARDEPGPYQLQAAIQAVHADARSIEDTDWRQIVAIYDQLVRMTKSPVVELNRAIAVGELDGPGAALELVDALDLDRYYLFHATRADLLRRLGRDDAANDAFEAAAGLAPTEAEREHLRARIRPGAHEDRAKR